MNISSSYLKDVSPIYLARLAPQEIVAWCEANRYNFSICTEDLWRKLLLIRYGNIITELPASREYQQRYLEELNMLYKAVAGNDSKFVAELAERVNVNLRTKGKLDNVRTLLENGADPNLFNPTGNTALLEALVILK